MTLPRRSLQNWITLGILLICLVLVLLDRTGFGAASTPGEVSGTAGVISLASTSLYGWAVVLAAVALLLGAVNLLWVHILRIQHGQPGWWQSMLLVVALVAVLIAGFVNPSADRSPLVEWTFDSLLAPGYAALFALLAFFTASAIYQHLGLRSRSGRWVLVGLVAMALAQMPAARLFLPVIFSTAATWVVDVPLTATMRGALLGMALALVIVAVRFLMGRRA